jgi:hypothetical protein
MVIPLSGRMPGRASGPSRPWVNDGGDRDVFLENWSGPLGFSHRGVFIDEGAASEVDQGGLTMGGRGQGLGRAPLWCGQAVAPLCLLFGLLKASVNIRMFGFCFVQF